MTTSKKIALVTGGSKGIGLGIATHLAEQGYSVAITSRSKESADNIAQSTTQLLSTSSNGSLAGFAFDMEQSAAPKQLIDAVVDHYGQLDLIVNNALASSITADFTEVEEEVLESAIQANVTNVIKLCRYARPHLRETKGSIINIASSITRRYVVGLPIYAMAKAGLLKLTEALAAEWSAEGIRVNAINPGFTHSSAAKDMGLNDEQVNKIYEYLNNYQPLGSAEPKDIAPLVSFLASTQAKMITGAIFDVDGGHHIQGHPFLPPDLFE